jgi:hypothetical protein
MNINGNNHFWFPKHGAFSIACELDSNWWNEGTNFWFMSV